MNEHPRSIPAGYFPPQGNPGLCSTDKSPPAATSVSRSESPLDGICLSEAEKTAVLTLIREEVTTGDPALPGCTPVWQPPRGCPSPDPMGGGWGQLCPARGGPVSCTPQAQGRKGNHQSVPQGSPLCCNLDNHKGDRSKPVEEEIRREPPGGLRDEVGAFARRGRLHRAVPRVLPVGSGLVGP